MNKNERLAEDGWEESDPDPILFYAPKDEFGWMSNFSGHGLFLPNPFTDQEVYYKTGEHRFQAMKASSFEAHEQIRRASSAYYAKEYGGPGPLGITTLPDDWGSTYGGRAWFVMLETIMAKVANHSPLRVKLIATGDRLIYEDSPIDDIWGWRFENDYRGENLLGRCWMAIRDVLIGADNE